MKTLILVLLLLLLPACAWAGEFDDALRELNEAAANLTQYRETGAKLDAAIGVANARRTQAALAERQAAVDMQAAITRLQDLLRPCLPAAPAAPLTRVVYTTLPHPVYVSPPVYRPAVYSYPAAIYPGPICGPVCPVPW